jgi:mRNA-degrading endonuclease toxin of MazEF toxin-antitoxin module
MPDIPKDMMTSTPLWTTPEPGDVIHYTYLWKDEAARGLEEGKKTRPCLVLSARVEAKGLVVRVVPISTRNYSKEGVPITRRVQAHLRLSDESTIVPTEINRFVWVGPDVVRFRDGSAFYGKVPPLLFDQVRNIVLKKRRDEIARTE